MKKFKTFINKLRMSQQFAANKAVDYINSTSVSDIIEEYNRKQLSEGYDSEGDLMGSYSFRRKGERLDAGKQVEFIDLNFTGTFYRGILAEGKLKGAESAEIAFSNPTDRWSDLQNDETGRFDKALGLTQEDANKVADMVAEHISKELNKYYSV